MWKNNVENDCDRDKMEHVLGRMHFQKQCKQCFGIFKISGNAEFILKKVKENFEEYIASIFSYIFS